MRRPKAVENFMKNKPGRMMWRKAGHFPNRPPKEKRENIESSVPRLGGSKGRGFRKPGRTRRLNEGLDGEIGRRRRKKKVDLESGKNPWYEKAAWENGAAGSI